MKSLKIRITALVLLMAFIAIGSTGCYKMEYLDNDYAVSVIKELMASADEINRIHYGIGLEREEGDEGASYANVKASEKYKSIKDIEEFTRSVLSKKYADALLSNTCEGANARYIEVGSVDNKQLLVKKEMSQIPEIYSYDLESIEIVQATKLEISATIKSTSGNIKRVKAVSQTENGEMVWRLESTTY